jgi:RNA polymerase sigma factor (sigma-70 family)
VDIVSCDWLEEPELVDFETPESVFVKHELLDALEKAIDLLTEEERQILIYAFGLREQKPLTIYQIARKMHISQDLICRIYRKALSRLKDALI